VADEPRAAAITHTLLSRWKGGGTTPRLHSGVSPSAAAPLSALAQISASASASASVSASSHSVQRASTRAASSTSSAFCCSTEGASLACLAKTPSGVAPPGGCDGGATAGQSNRWCCRHAASLQPMEQ